MRTCGYSNSELWNSKGESHNYLSAPTEVHFSVTNRCAQNCNGCYMNSTSTTIDDLSTEMLKISLKELCDMGVFHVALGGGEAFERDDFGEIVRYCREIGLIPNLTTNGQRMGKREIDICRIMGQVNISLDGTGLRYGINGRMGSFKKADNAFRALTEAGVNVGINCVVSSKNYPYLEDVLSYARLQKLNEVEFLKYKPSGRGCGSYKEFALSQDMIREFYPMITILTKQYESEIKIDCSFIPALLYHHPPKDVLERLAVTGCDGGNVLLSVRNNGLFSGCSFVENSEDVAGIKKLWHDSKHLSGFRALTSRAQEPCATCEYLSLCRCGCRAVSIHETGDFFAPDPECPFVYDYRAEKALNLNTIDSTTR